MINVLVWNEYGKKPWEDAQYAGGLHLAIAEFLGKNQDFKVSTATLDDPDCGLSGQTLDNTDVLVYWAHCRHGELTDEAAARVRDAVQRGMGVIFLHSAHKSKPFMWLTGGSGSLKWREANEKERLWVVDPSHPIVQGLPETFTLDREEMYGEPFDIPTPDSTVLIGWFEGGNVFRSGVTYTRGYGKIFYFQPGHETYPTYRNENVQKVITNAVRFVQRTHKMGELVCPNEKESLEPIAKK